MRRTLLAGAALLATAALAAADPPQAVERALESITADDLRAHLRFLADDLLDGRAPGTPGSRMAQLYIETQFERVGLQPVLDSGYRQRITLSGRTPDRTRMSLGFDVGDQTVPAAYPEQVVFWSGRETPNVEVRGELVFAGYGVQAPEHSWNDFEGHDVEGKVLLVLVNDPPAPPEEPELFGGSSMTYYGRWSYKLEEARRQGAAGALIIHAPHSAGYSWNVVESSWTGEQYDLPRADEDGDALALEGWIRRDFARDVLERAGLNLQELYVRAARRDFRPIETGITLHAEIASRTRRVETANVIGMVPGSNPERRDEVVVYTAHYDHLGVGSPDADGDSIYNGAYDNASGVALLLELAEGFARAESRPARSILFIATAAEEAGMLGAEYYVRNPAVSLARTAAVINVDGANLWGETDDVVALGAERSSLGSMVQRRAGELGMRLTPERAPGKGYFFRSDHFPFARAGVPAIQLEHGLEYRGRPDGWGEDLLARYDTERYHRPGDEFDPDFELAGAVQQARLALLVGYDVAQTDSMPAWKATAGYGPRPSPTGPSVGR